MSDNIAKMSNLNNVLCSDIVKLESNVLELLNKMQINLYDGEVKINLMDLMSLKIEFIKRDTLANILSLYIAVNKLDNWDKITSDEILSGIFGKNIGKLMRWGVGMSIHIIFETYDYYQHVDILQNQHLISCLLFATSLIFLSNNFDVYSILHQLRINGDETKALEAHPKINKLCVSVLFDNIDTVSRHLHTLDPSYNNYKAYKIALNWRDTNIINAVLNNIVTRILLHKTILNMYIYSDCFVHDIYNLITTFF